jgi:Fe-S-cluster formation regulator IscX/YfhJ
MVKTRMVKTIMLDSKRIATPLYELNMLLKTQKKWSDEMIEDDFKRLATQVYSEWRNQYPSQVPFPKLHDMVRHILDFVNETRIYGRLSEESFQSHE